MESAGYTLHTLWDGDSQANCTAGFANNDVVYIPSDVPANNISNKLQTCSIGVVNELPELMDSLGLASQKVKMTTASSINISPNARPFGRRASLRMAGRCSLQSPARGKPPSRALS